MVETKIQKANTITANKLSAFVVRVTEDVKNPEHDVCGSESPTASQQLLYKSSHPQLTAFVVYTKA